MATSDVRALIQSASFNGQPPFPGSDDQSVSELVVFRDPTEPHLRFSVYQAADSGKFKCKYQVDSRAAEHRIPSIATTNIELGVYEAMLMKPLRQCGFFEEMRGGGVTPATVEKVKGVLTRVMNRAPERCGGAEIPEEQRLDLKNRATNLMLFSYNKEFEFLYKFAQQHMGLDKSQALQYLALGKKESIADAIGCAAYQVNPAVKLMMMMEIKEIISSKATKASPH